MSRRPPGKCRAIARRTGRLRENASLLLAARLRRRGLRGGLGGLVLPLVLRPASGVHEEVAHGAELQAQLLRDGDLHFLRGSLGLLKDGLQGAPLQVGEHEAGLLGLALGAPRGPTRRFLFPLAGWNVQTGGHSTTRQRRDDSQYESRKHHAGGDEQLKRYDMTWSRRIVIK